MFPLPYPRSQVQYKDFIYLPPIIDPIPFRSQCKDAPIKMYQQSFEPSTSKTDGKQVIYLKLNALM